MERSNMQQRPSPRPQTARRLPFSWFDLVVAAAAVTVVASMVVPRLGNAAPPDPAAQLFEDLSVLRSALVRYGREHGGNPPRPGHVLEALTQYTDLEGNYSPSRSRSHALGPYLTRIPPLPVGQWAGCTGIGDALSTNAGGAGWIYDPADGLIAPNTGLMWPAGLPGPQRSEVVDASDP